MATLLTGETFLPTVEANNRAPHPWPVHDPNTRVRLYLSKRGAFSSLGKLAKSLKLSSSGISKVAFKKIPAKGASQEAKLAGASHAAKPTTKTQQSPVAIASSPEPKPAPSKITDEISPAHTESPPYVIKPSNTSISALTESPSSSHVKEVRASQTESSHKSDDMESKDFRRSFDFVTLGKKGLGGLKQSDKMSFRKSSPEGEHREEIKETEDFAALNEKGASGGPRNAEEIPGRKKENISALDEDAGNADQED